MAGLKRGRGESILAEVRDAVRGWPDLAAEHGIDRQMAEQIAASHRLKLPAA